MQMESVGGRARIQRVAENGRVHRREMHAELMRAAGLGPQNNREIGARVDRHGPVAAPVDDLHAALGGGSDACGDAAVTFEFADPRHYCRIGFRYRVGLEGGIEGDPYRTRAREYDQS